MTYRCYTPTCKSFTNYGGRGIYVCDAWRDSFETFLRDVGHRPSAKHSLDRINNDGDYEPGNVRWATCKEQRDNTRLIHRLTFNGETLPLTDWARRIGISQPVLRRRIVELKWPLERALTMPSRGYRHH